MNVTQTIPNFLGGISQQPDYEKVPGTLKNIKNAYPDITYGLQKRHGARFEYDLGTDEDLDGGLWFNTVTDDNLAFFGVILPANTNRPNASIKMWRSADGVEQTVTGSFSYLECNDRTTTPLTKESYKTISINQAIIVVNRNCKVDVDTTPTPGTLKATITTVAELPETATNGDIYYITNGTTDLDDYYVIWEDGAWTETVKPGIDKGFDSSTMPHALVYDGTNWTFSPVSYLGREVGNESTNPHPSFVTRYIENAFFYLNRIGLLSRNNVILSEPLTPEIEGQPIQDINFYRISTITQSPAGPIDLNASSVRPTTLRSVQPAFQGLILFGTTEQFYLYSEQGVVTPQTGVIKSLSTYELDGDVNAIELGDEYYFVSKTLRHTRVFKMVPRGLQQGPLISEITRIITDFIPNTIETLTNNSQNTFLSLTNSDDPYMYIYRSYIENGEILFNAWYTWELIGKIKSCVFVRDQMYVITSQGGRHAVSSITLNTIPEEDILTNIEQETGFIKYLASIGPYLDMWIGQKRFTVTPSSTRTDNTGKVTVINPYITFPSGYPSNVPGKTPCVIQSVDELNRSTLSEVGTGATFPVEIQQDGTWVIKGNFDPSDLPYFVAGYRYDYDLLLPDYYFNTGQDTDYTAYLNINRYKFIFKDASELQFLTKSWGKNDMAESSSDWTVVKGSPEPRYYDLDRSPIYQEVEFVVPIHQRNTNFKMRIFSDSPFPVTLNKLMWEGNYSPRYYRRV